jgi:multidrug efflux pump
VIPRFFVDRPIFATVLSVILTLAGGVAAFTLPVSQYPEIAPPTVEVAAVFPGANATIVSDTIAAPIEQQVNGVEDMMYLSSQCTNDGGYTLTVTFKPGTDLNVAQVLVQNRVNLALPVLPDLVKRRGVSVKKKSPSVLLIVNLISPDGSKDDLYLSNYATIQLRDELARVSGVGDITVLGQRDYAMRVWLDPEKMAGRGLAASDVVHAVEQQNVQVAAGQLGQPPSPSAVAFQFTLNTLGRLSDPKQFEDVIVKVDAVGGVTRVKDIGRVELAAATYDQTCTLDGKPSVALSVYQLPGSNAIATAERVRERLVELRGRLPAGVETSIVYDTTPFVRESVSEVFAALRDAVLLVAGVMLAFLRTWRTTLVPLVAVPVAVVGTFAAMAAFGFGLNALTLFGLVLAVGIVVDDAIVVVEAVEHHLATGLSPRDATIKAMDQVAGPVVAVGLVLAAVFVPCLFVSGVVGQFFRQFAVTIAISTMISAFNSLTLSPALCALLLKPHGHGKNEALPRLLYPFLGAVAAYVWLGPLVSPWLEKLPAAWLDAIRPVRPYVAPVLAGLVGAVIGGLVAKLLNLVLGFAIEVFNRLFNVVTAGYMGIVSVLLYVTPLALMGYTLLVGATEKVLESAPTGFIPSQDKGYLLVNLQLPDATSLTRTREVVATAEALARTVPGVSHTIAVAGQSVLLNAAAPNFGSLYVMLDDFPKRPGRDRGAEAIAATLRAKFSETLSTAAVTVFGAPPVDGLGTAGGFKLILLDPAGTAAASELERVGRETVAALSQNPNVRDAVCGYRANSPWLELDVDRVQAAEYGVGVGEIASALQVYFGTFYVNDFNRFGRTWQVTLQADGGFRQTAADLLRLGVKNDHGDMVPLRSFATLKESTGPILIQRYNLYPAVGVNLTPAPGVSSGQAIKAGDDAALAALPPTLRHEWTELALLQLETGNTAMIAFALSVALVFLVLAAQYESWALPLAVILVVPLCLSSAAVGVILAGLDVNVFTQVGFVVLVGLAGKNAILIVEYARARHLEGATVRQATLDACRLRFRPIVMTSVAFILGVVPLLAATGAGAEMRRTLGTAVFSGMIGVTLFGVFLTPVFYFAIQWTVDAVWARKRPFA